MKEAAIEVSTEYNELLKKKKTLDNAIPEFWLA